MKWNNLRWFNLGANLTMLLNLFLIRMDIIVLIAILISSSFMIIGIIATKNK